MPEIMYPSATIATPATATAAAILSAHTTMSRFALIQVVTLTTMRVTAPRGP